MKKLLALLLVVWSATAYAVTSNTFLRDDGTFHIVDTIPSAAGAGTFCLQISPSGVISNTGATCGSGGAGTVNSVSNSDGTLTISPTTGAVVASLALGHANTWTAAQTHNNGFLVMAGSSSGTTTLEASAAAGTTIATFPANTGTVAELNFAQTWTAAQTYNNGFLVMAGATSGTTTLEATAVAGTTFAIFPANTGTVAELNLAQTWTAAQTFNNTDLVMAGSSSGTTTLVATAIAGSTTATFPANTGTVAELNLAQTWTATQTFPANSLTLSEIAQIPANTLLGNTTSGSANVVASTLTAHIDADISSTRGAILERGASAWVAITPGTSGLPFVSNGTGADPAYQLLSTSGIANNAVTLALMAQIPANTLLSNNTGGTANVAANTLTSIVDADIGSTRGAILERGSSAWVLITPGTSGLPFVSNGTGADPAYQLLTTSGIANNAITNALLAQMPALTHKCNPTNSTANAQDCSYPILNVVDYGATGNGSTDDTTAIQNTINALPASGGIVLFPVGNYKISSPLTIGNGTSSAVSTRQGVILRGIGMPVKSSLTGFTATSGPTLTWAGSTNSQMVAIKGPLVGWGVENLVFECGSTTGLHALDITSGQHGDSKNLVFNKCNTAINSGTVDTFVGVNNTDSFHNNFTNILINMPDIATNNNGFVLTGSGNATPNSDTDFNTVVNLTCLATSISNTSSCIYLQVSDGNWFYGIHVTGGFSNLRAVSFDYGVNNGFPVGNKFFGLDPGGANRISVNGSPCGTSFCGDNELYGVSTANGGNLQILSGVTYVFPGVTCSGSPTVSFSTFDGIVTHC